MKLSERWYRGLGHFTTLLGIAGSVLPLLPATPFFLLSIFFYRRGAPQYMDWILQHPRFGPGIRAWQTQGVIGFKSKILALGMIWLGAIWSNMALATKLPLAARVALLTILAAVSLFIATRPSKLKLLDHGEHEHKSE